MRSPIIACKIEILAQLHPSEDPKKVETSILNIFPNAKITTTDSFITSNSNDIRFLEKIYEFVRSKQFQKIYQRQLEKNLEGNSTWFYLNKQAAFVEIISICEEADESPLGPIKVTLTSTNIDKLIEWFVFKH